VLALAWRNLFRHRGRTAATLAALAFGVAGLILAGGFVRDIFVQLAEALIHSQSGHIQVLRTGYFDAGTRFPERYRIEDPKPVERAVAALPEVRDVIARLSFSGLLNNGRADWGVVGEGVEADKELRLGTYVHTVAGRALNASDELAVTIGQGVAQALKLAPGDRATLLLNTAEGAVNSVDVEVVGVFQTYSKDFDARAVRMPLATAQDLLGTAGVNSLVVVLDDTAATDRTVRRIGELLGGKDLEAKGWRELSDFYDKTVALYERQFGVLQLIILGMVFLSVANSVNLNVWEREGEFGTMRALGNTRRTIASTIVIETALLGLVGSALGTILGVGGALALSAIGIPMPPPPNANLGYVAQVRIVPSIVVAAFVIGTVAALLASLLPAIRISRQPIAQALRANV